MKIEWSAKPHPAYPQEVVVMARADVGGGQFYHIKSTLMANIAPGRFWKEIDSMRRILARKHQEQSA